MHADQMRRRIAEWANALKARPTQIRIQQMTRKWASCSSAGRVTFSRELLDQPAAFQDYVIVHELLHLRIRNHGKLFAATLRAHLPDNPWVNHAWSANSRQRLNNPESTCSRDHTRGRTQPGAS